MLNRKIGKLFSVTLFITVISWALAYVFAAMAGETVKSTLHKFQAQSQNERAVVETERTLLDGVETIEINSNSPDIVVDSSGSASEAEITFKGTAQNPEKVLQVHKDGNRLSIELKRWQKSGFHINLSGDISLLEGHRSNELTVKLPSSYKNNLQIKSSSGDVELENLHLSSIDVHASSGDIQAHACQATKSNLHTSSGDLTLKELQGALEAQASSGNILVEAFKGSGLKVHSSSGDITLVNPETEDIDGSANSGDIKVQLKDGHGWKMQLRAVSGGVHNEWSDEPSGSRRLELHTSSGDIRVTR